MKTTGFRVGAPSTNSWSLSSFLPLAPFLFSSPPLRTACAHTHKDQKFCEEMHPHRCLYLETHMARFRRPNSTDPVHVKQKKTYPQGDIHNLIFYTKTKWNPTFTEFRLAMCRTKHTQSFGILLLARHSLEEISADTHLSQIHTDSYVQITQGKKNHNNHKTNLSGPTTSLTTLIHRRLPRPLQPKQSLSPLQETYIAAHLPGTHLRYMDYYCTDGFLATPTTEKTWNSVCGCTCWHTYAYMCVHAYGG